ncbi:hypothetical protein GCM10011519_13750 [Marmoricola endophyticus]|uniref:HTH arsR-type domain-containing protein n=1 Tax=Marmoricola endophyticus TaxID=2040280 RepID=A0A917BG24_9ACTN|nr:helix-turn-helix domain-containing protein [Marmoricola endophyticus]GGF41238.1 hypothetical protein GCM10011519_13750 [Marmoricola endophyticus]
MVSIDTLVAVHHPVRRRIVDRLVLDGPAQVGTLARELDEQIGSISHHLRILERVEVVVRAPELSTDGRTSWWRASTTSFSWAVDDFADRPADQHRARVADRLNAERHFTKLADWKRREAAAPEAWRRAAYSTDSLGRATAVELEELMRRLVRTVAEWKADIDLDDGQEREPVFMFSHGFPSRP